MATQFAQQVTDLITTNRKADKVKRWQELSAAAALIETEMKALKAGILETNDPRFKIVEETIRESARPRPTTSRSTARPSSRRTRRSPRSSATSKGSPNQPGASAPHPSGSVCCPLMMAVRPKRVIRHNHGG